MVGENVQDSEAGRFLLVFHENGRPVWYPSVRVSMKGRRRDLSRVIIFQCHLIPWIWKNAFYTELHKLRNNPEQDGGMRYSSGADVSSIKQFDPCGHLERHTLFDWRDRRTSQKDCHLPQLSEELSRFGVSVPAFSKIRRSGNGWIIGLGTPAAVPQGHLQNWLWPSPTDWSYCYWGYPRQRAYHQTENPPCSGCYLSALYVCSRASEFSVKHRSTHSSRWDGLNDQGFLIGISWSSSLISMHPHKVGYRSCVSSHGSGVRNNAYCLFLISAESRSWGLLDLDSWGRTCTSLELLLEQQWYKEGHRLRI